MPGVIYLSHASSYKPTAGSLRIPQSAQPMLGHLLERWGFPGSTTKVINRNLGTNRRHHGEGGPASDFLTCVMMSRTLPSSLARQLVPTTVETCRFHEGPYMQYTMILKKKFTCLESIVGNAIPILDQLTQTTHSDKATAHKKYKSAVQSHNW